MGIRECSLFVQTIVLHLKFIFLILLVHQLSKLSNLNKTILIFIVLTILALSSGCQTVAYYAQAAKGQAQIIFNQQLINHVLQDANIQDSVKDSLREIQKMREFASHKLGLPNNKSYTRYVDTGREFVVWNVVATPRFSVDPVVSCFPIAGCVSYRGYFHKNAAQHYAATQNQLGRDVYVGGVSAYSTLGWFDDPVLNTMLSRSPAQLAALVFHELAHQKIYVKNDTRFNESFASAVAQLGLQLWAKQQGKSAQLKSYFSFQKKHQEVVKLILKASKSMRDAYAKNPKANKTQLSQLKQKQFDKLRKSYADLQQKGGGTKGFDAFFKGELNHAMLALFGDYHGLISAFTQLFKQSNEDWTLFYTKVQALSRLSKRQRDLQLSQLTLEAKASQ